MLSVEKKATIQKKVDINFFSSMSRFQRPLFISTSIKNCFFANGGNFFSPKSEKVRREIARKRDREFPTHRRSRAKKSRFRETSIPPQPSQLEGLFFADLFIRGYNVDESLGLSHSLSLFLFLSLTHSLLQAYHAAQQKT